MEVDISKTFGALLLGGLYASLLSGFVSVQVIVYFKLYPEDRRQIKTLVVVVWLLDASHTTFIWSALWNYLINDYGFSTKIDDIHWSLAMTVLTTAIVTFFVHLFFAHRIFMLGRRNYWLSIPIMALAFLRLSSASVSTREMFHLGTLTRFTQDVRWIFTIGLALSTAADVLIMGSSFGLLQCSRTRTTNLNVVIGTLIKYAFETGALTCAGTVATMTCWLIMPNNLVFMGFHFVIGKLYANSLLVTLNTRETIRRGRLKGLQQYPSPTCALEASKPRCAGDAERLEFNANIEEIPGIHFKEFLPLEVHIERSVHRGP